MKEISSHIKHHLQTLETVRADYLSKQDRLRLNTNQKLHEYLLSVYTVAVPELLIELYTLLKLYHERYHEHYSVRSVSRRLERPLHSKRLNSAYVSTDEQTKIIALCTAIEFFAEESDKTLQLLSTIL